MLFKKGDLGKPKKNTERFSLTPTATMNTKHSLTPSRENKKNLVIFNSIPAIQYIRSGFQKKKKFKRYT